MSIGRNVLKLTTSKVASQAVAFATAPFIARLYAPEDFGVRQIFASIAGTIVVVSCLRYELSIPLGKDRKEATASLILSIGITFAFGISSLLAVALLRNQVAVWFKTPKLASFLWLIPAYILLSGWRNAMGYMAAREGKFGAMAWSGFASAIAGSGTSILWAMFLGATTAGLYAGMFAALIVGIIVISVFLVGGLVRTIMEDGIGLSDVVSVAGKHRKFPIFSTWSGLLNTVSAELPSIILGVYFTTTVVGYYALANKIVALPMSLLAVSIGQVFYPLAGEQYNRTQSISSIVQDTYLNLVQIGMFPLIAVVMFGKILFGLFFGEEWSESGVYAQIIGITFLSRFIASPMTTIFSIKRCQGKGLVYNIILSLSRSIILLLASSKSTARIALAAYSITNFIIYFSTLLWLLHISQISVWWAIRTFLKYMFGSILLLSPALIIYSRVSNSLVVLISVLLLSVLYLLTFWRGNQSLFGKSQDVED